MKPGDKQKAPAIRKARGGRSTLEAEYTKTVREVPGGQVQASYTSVIFRLENDTWTVPFDAKILGALLEHSPIYEEVTPPPGQSGLRDSDSLLPLTAGRGFRIFISKEGKRTRRHVTTGASPQLDALVAAEQLDQILHSATPKERAVLLSRAKGESFEEAARNLRIKPVTARVHWGNLLKKARIVLSGVPKK
jgi:hypothetical protein